MTALLLVINPCWYVVGRYGSRHNTPRREQFSRAPTSNELALLGVGSQVIFVRSTVLGTGMDDEYRYDIDSIEYPSDIQKWRRRQIVSVFVGYFIIFGCWFLLYVAIVLLHITFTYINIIPRAYTLHSIFVEVPVDSSWKKNTAVTFLCVWAFE